MLDAESEEQQFSGCKKPEANVLDQVVFLVVRLEGGWVSSGGKGCKNVVNVGNRVGRRD